MSKRHISNNIKHVLNLIYYSDFCDDNNFILFVDFHKAFDTTERGFIFLALNRFGFGPFFIKAITTLYNNANCSIKLHAGTSPKFDLNRGISQVCPISPYLFLIGAQLLCDYIKLSHLEGIKLADREIVIVKCELFALRYCTNPSIVGIPVKDSITYLGIVISRNLSLRCSLNFAPVLQKTQNIFNAWF